MYESMKKLLAGDTARQQLLLPKILEVTPAQGDAAVMMSLGELRVKGHHRLVARQRVRPTAEFELRIAAVELCVHILRRQQ